MIDKLKIEEHIKGILEALGDDPQREGLLDTPKRVANMFEEVFAGIQYSNDDIAQMMDKTFEDQMDFVTNSKDMVLMKNIEIFSYCEHHLALMYNMKVAVAYLPKGKIIGLSKIARVADLVSKRLQLQERIGTDIASIISKITDSEDVAVIISGEHSCMTARGINKNNAQTVTTTLRGRFLTEAAMCEKLMMLYNHLPQ